MRYLSASVSIIVFAAALPMIVPAGRAQKVPGLTSPAPERVKYATVGDIPVQEGFTRLGQGAGSFGSYLRALPLKHDNDTVYLYNGQPKASQQAHFAILEMDIGKRDLQQCADAAIRLRAEYLYQAKKYSDISFRFVSGDVCAWVKYADGYRCTIAGNKVRWSKSAGEDHSYSNFRRYLDLVFSYAGTASLGRDLPQKDIGGIMPGDVFIDPRQPYGHAVIVMDVATGKDNQRIFMLAQSYMPAQEIEILLNPAHNGHSPWYSIPPGALYTPEWTFKADQLRHF